MKILTSEKMPYFVNKIKGLLINKPDTLELTQSEYDALEVKNEDTLYFITDSDENGNVINTTDEYIKNVIANDDTVAKTANYYTKSEIESKYSLKSTTPTIFSTIYTPGSNLSFSGTNITLNITSNTNFKSAQSVYKIYVYGAYTMGVSDNEFSIIEITAYTPALTSNANTMAIINQSTKNMGSLPTIIANVVKFSDDLKTMTIVGTLSSATYFTYAHVKVVSM